jgi:LysM domain
MPVMHADSACASTRCRHEGIRGPARGLRLAPWQPVQRYDRPASRASSGAAVADPAPLTPGKATLVERLVQHDAERPQAIALVDAGLRGGAAPSAALAMRSAVAALGSTVRVHVGAAASALARAAGAPVVVVDDHIVVDEAIDASSAAGAAQVDTAIARSRGASAAATAAGTSTAAAGASAATTAGASPAGASAAATASPSVAATASVAPGDAAATATPGRALELWPGGPVTKSKAQVRSLAEYLPLLRAFEAVYGSGADAVARLRRLSYSAFSHIQREGGNRDGAPKTGPAPGSTGGKFDLLISTNDRTDAPATTPPLAADVLDQLFDTGALTMPDGQQVDLSHLYCLLDFDANGEGAAGTAIGALTGASVAGILSWTGDLASWYLQWRDPNMRGGIGEGAGGGDGAGEGGEVGEGAGEIGEGGGDAGAGEGAGDGGGAGGGDGKEAADRINEPDRAITGTLPEKIAELNKLRDTKTAIDDLLGDMDAHALGNQMRPVVAAGGGLADAIEAYYTNQTDQAADHRFHQFVAHAVPAIPHVVVASAPLGVALDAGAGDAIYDSIYDTYQALSIHPQPVLDELDVMRYVSDQFTEFLAIGLATGQVCWPPSTAVPSGGAAAPAGGAYLPWPPREQATWQPGSEPGAAASATPAGAPAIASTPSPVGAAIAAAPMPASATPMAAAAAGDVVATAVETYVVQPGDTLREIAELHRVAPEALLEANRDKVKTWPGAEGRQIQGFEAGDTIVIPRPAPAAPAAPTWSDWARQTAREFGDEVAGIIERGKQLLESAKDFLFGDEAPEPATPDPDEPARLPDERVTHWVDVAARCNADKRAAGKATDPFNADAIDGWLAELATDMTATSDPVQLRILASCQFQFETTKRGTDYNYGSDRDYAVDGSFDCSEAVQWMMMQAGLGDIFSEANAAVATLYMNQIIEGIFGCELRSAPRDGDIVMFHGHTGVVADVREAENIFYVSHMGGGGSYFNAFDLQDPSVKDAERGLMGDAAWHGITGYWAPEDRPLPSPIGTASVADKVQRKFFLPNADSYIDSFYERGDQLELLKQAGAFWLARRAGSQGAAWVRSDGLTIPATAEEAAAGGGATTGAQDATGEPAPATP